MANAPTRDGHLGCEHHARDAAHRWNKSARFPVCRSGAESAGGYADERRKEAGRHEAREWRRCRKADIDPWSDTTGRKKAAARFGHLAVDLHFYSLGQSRARHLVDRYRGARPDPGDRTLAKPARDDPAIRRGRAAFCAGDPHHLQPTALGAAARRMAPSLGGTQPAHAVDTPCSRNARCHIVLRLRSKLRTGHCVAAHERHAGLADRTARARLGARQSWTLVSFAPLRACASREVRAAGRARCLAAVVGGGIRSHGARSRREVSPYRRPTRCWSRTAPCSTHGDIFSSSAICR